MSDLAAYAGLFASAFLSATVLPGASEAVLLGLLSADDARPVPLFAAALVGNVLGSLVTFAMGRFLLRFRGRRWFPVGDAAYARAGRWFHRWGIWALLLAWLPVVGDALVLVAGALRVPFAPFLLLLTLGKAARYLVVVMGGVAWFGTG